MNKQSSVLGNENHSQEKAHIESIMAGNPTEHLSAHLLTIDFSDVPAIWHKEGIFVSCYENSYSFMLPIAEDFMIQAMKSYYHEFKTKPWQRKHAFLIKKITTPELLKKPMSCLKIITMI